MFGIRNVNYKIKENVEIPILIMQKIAEIKPLKTNEEVFIIANQLKYEISWKSQNFWFSVIKKYRK